MFRIRMLPADYGDCLWIEYGNKKIHRILIDAGTLAAHDAVRACLENRLPANGRYFDLFLITHIDTDHIDTAVKLLNSPSLKVKFGQVWFNGWQQLLDADLLGPQQGEYLTALIESQAIPLNLSFDGRAIFVADKGRLPVYKLPGGMKMTILSPEAAQLRALREYWASAMGNAAGDSKAALQKLATSKKYKDALGKKLPDIDTLADTPSSLDPAVPNGSSIVVLAEFEGKRCLFASDAHPDVLERSIDRLLAKEGGTRLSLDALKVPHHGSKHNNPVSLYRKLNCRKYLISTNGKRFRHPHPEAVARIVKYGGPQPQLYFNYDSELTKRWDNPALMARYRYSVAIRRKSEASLDIDL